MRKTNFDTHLLSYRSRKISLTLLIIVMTIIIAAITMQTLTSELSWWKLGIPICTLGSVFLLFPPTEEWEYKAWQAKPRKVEQHFTR